MDQSLIHKNIISPSIKPDSPLKITERGEEILGNTPNLDEFLSQCPLIQNAEKFKDTEGFDIYLECLKWVKANGERKIAEIRYNNLISSEECSELLAVLIRDKIFKKINYSR